MPKIPDFIAKKMDERPERATEERAARSVLKHLGLAKADRDRVRRYIRKHHGIDSPDEWDVMLWALAIAPLYIGSTPVGVDEVSAVTVQPGEDPIEAVECVVPATPCAVRRKAPLILWRHYGSSDLQVSFPVWTGDGGLCQLDPPFSVASCKWRSYWWITQPVGVFLGSASKDEIIAFVNELARS